MNYLEVFKDRLQYITYYLKRPRVYYEVPEIHYELALESGSQVLGPHPRLEEVAARGALSGGREPGRAQGHGIAHLHVHFNR